MIKREYKSIRKRRRVACSSTLEHGYFRKVDLHPHGQEDLAMPPRHTRTIIQERNMK
jgi:hypothetical protein